MKCLINIFDTNGLEFEKYSIGENFSGSNHEIATSWKAEKLGFHLEILDPKKFGCPYHRHQNEEELFLAIKGEATVRQDGEFFKVKTGDLFLFKTGVNHQMYNHTDEPFIFFALSNNTTDEVCEYPDSNKRYEQLTKNVTKNGIKVDYWKDEHDPRKFWPKDIIGD